MIIDDDHGNRFVKIYQSLIKNPVFRTYTEIGPFVAMIIQAQWKPVRVNYKNRVLNLDRGQLALSLREFGKKCGWEETRVRRFLEKLENHHMIHRSTAAGVTVVTICNYNKYQHSGKPCAEEPPQQPPQYRRSAAAQNKKDKKDKKDSLVRESVPLTAREDTHTQNPNLDLIDDEGSSGEARDHPTDIGEAQPSVAAGEDRRAGAGRTRPDRTDATKAEKPFRLPPGFKVNKQSKRYGYGLGGSFDEVERTAENFEEHYTVGPGKKRERTHQGWSNCWMDWCDGDARNKWRASKAGGKTSTNDAFARAGSKVGRILERRTNGSNVQGVAPDKPLIGGSCEQGADRGSMDIGTGQISSGDRDPPRANDPVSLRLLPKTEAILG